MSGRGGQGLRYHIADEPQRRWWSKVFIPPMLLMPLTIYAALSWSLLFWLLPALNALLVNGNRRWLEIGLSVLSLVLFVAGIIGAALLVDVGLLKGLPRLLALDANLALAVLPMIKVMMEQERTLAFRRMIAG